MPTSVIGTNLVDELISVVDEIRSDLQVDLGHRQYNVTLVIREWDGCRVDEGTPRFVQEQLIDPQPAVMRRTEDGKLVPCGINEEGTIWLTEVSFTYQEAELYTPELDVGQEFYYRIEDAHGQGVRTRYYIATHAPVPDRPATNNRDPGDLGWMIELSQVDKDTDA